MLTTEMNDQRKPKFYIPAIYPSAMWENEIPVKGNYTYEDYKKLPEGVRRLVIYLLWLTRFLRAWKIAEFQSQCSGSISRIKAIAFFMASI
jgi:hypothetical protein